jgi:hypothetical protein
MLETEGLRGMTEYRLWITIPDLPIEGEDRWAPFIDHLERSCDYGAVLGWDGADARVTLSLAAEDEAAATQAVVDAITVALHETGLGDHYPSAVEVETVPAREFQPA